MIAAAILGRAGRRVLLVERQAQLGGRLRSSAVEGGWVVDDGAYLWPDAWISEALRRAGADDFVASEIPREHVLRLFVEGEGGRRLAFPYPLRDASPKLLDTARTVLGVDAAGYAALTVLWQRCAALSDAEVEALRCVPLRDGLKRLGADPELAAALQCNVMLYGTYDPASASTAECIELCRRPADRPLARPVVPGANPGGGVAALVRSLERALTTARVEVRTGAEVVAVRTAGSVATGVAIESGGSVSDCAATDVVLNVPIAQAAHLLPADLKHDLGGAARAWSAVGGVIAAAFAFRGMLRLRETGEPDEFPGWTRLLTRGASGGCEFGGGMLWTTLHSPANAPPGQHVLQAMRLSPHSDVDDPARVVAVHDGFERLIREIYLDVDERLLWTRRWATRDGSEYLIAAAPRPPVRAPGVAGLYFVGETTDVPAVQMDAAALSALRCAEMILEGRGAGGGG